MLSPRQLGQHAYALTKGNIANQVVALYKTLGGGWEEHAGIPLVEPETVEAMQGRSDWGDALAPDKLQSPSVTGAGSSE